MDYYRTASHTMNGMFISKDKNGLTQRAPDKWDSPRFQAVCVARGWFRQNGVVAFHPPAGNASR
jgi:hypothetical protein